MGLIRHGYDGSLLTVHKCLYVFLTLNLDHRVFGHQAKYSALLGAVSSFLLLSERQVEHAGGGGRKGLTPTPE